jgi:hypothetical protein
MRWVGIDEAGYGPNFGPLVMTAVIAEGPGRRRPDLWKDLPATLARAGGDAELLWVDDSKRIYAAGRGFSRLEAACLAALSATGAALPATFADLLDALGAGTIEDVELSPWLGEACPPALPRSDRLESIAQLIERRPFAGARWRLIDVRTVMIGPAQFNDELAATGSKAKVHFNAFARLLERLWQCAADGQITSIRADKHGGRHFYLEPLYRALPDSWIDRGEEGPERSRYVIRDGTRRLELTLQPRADGDDGLVALASIISKCLRELWMEVFNAHWTARISGLKPTAGYPGDSARFRLAIEPDCRARALDPCMWWRER